MRVGVKYVLINIFDVVEHFFDEIEKMRRMTRTAVTAVTAVTRDASVKQHDAVECDALKKYDACPALNLRLSKTYEKKCWTKF